MKPDSPQSGWASAFAVLIGTSPANVSRWIDRGMPEGDDEAARIWVGANTRHSVTTSALDGILSDATTDMDGPLGAYARAKAAERRISVLMESDETDPKTMLALVTAHAKACQSVADRVDEAARYVEASRALQPTAELKAALSSHVGATVSIARAMPRTVGPRLEGMSTEQRVAELEQWVEGTLLATLRETEPFK